MGSRPPLPPSNPEPLLTLRITEGEDAGRTIVLGKDSVIGRDLNSDIVLTDTSGTLSRRHACISVREGAAVVEDLSSSNGTFVNGQRVISVQYLRAGDEITIGATTLTLGSAPDHETRHVRVTDRDGAIGPRVRQRAPAVRVDGELRVISGPAVGTAARITGGSATIGRERGCDLAVLDSKVSRRHAQVTVHDGVATICDLDSGNGTYVNGSRIVESHTLHTGDLIQVGKSTIELIPPGVEDAVAGEPAPQVPTVAEAPEPPRTQVGAESAAAPAMGGIQIAPRRWLALAILLVAGFMDLLDTSIVNVAIPAIRGDLHASFASVQWFIDGYLTAVAVLLIAGGRLGDTFGRKRVFVYSVCAFGLMSLASGLAPTPGILILTRVLQGLSAAVMIPQILSVIQVNFPREEQPRALALYSSVAGIAVMTGPLTAGILLDVLKFSWRSIFLINVPVCVVVAVAAVAFVPESQSRDAARMDPGGVALVGCALFALVFGIIEGRAVGWPVWDIALIAASVPLALLFARWENAIERRGDAPLISMNLFRERTFSCGVIVVVVFFSGLVGFFLAFTIFLQIGLGFTPIQSALTTFPSSVGLVVASQVSNRLSRRLGRRLLSIGALVMAAAQVGLIAMVHAHGRHLTAWDVRPVILVFGLGMGLILPTLADGIVSHVHRRNAGAASGIINTGLQVGNAIGAAAIGIILFSSLASHSFASANDQQRALATSLSTHDIPSAIRARVLTDFRACFVDKAHSADPAASPPSCRREAADTALPGAGRRIRSAVSAATVRGRKDNFVVGIERALIWEVAVFLATFGLLFVLPRTTGTRTESALPGP